MSPGAAGRSYDGGFRPGRLSIRNFPAAAAVGAPLRPFDLHSGRFPKSPRRGSSRGGVGWGPATAPIIFTRVNLT